MWYIDLLLFDWFSLTCRLSSGVCSLLLQHNKVQSPPKHSWDTWNRPTLTVTCVGVSVCECGLFIFLQTAAQRSAPGSRTPELSLLMYVPVCCPTLSASARWTRTCAANRCLHGRSLNFMSNTTFNRFNRAAHRKRALCCTLQNTSPTNQLTGRQTRQRIVCNNIIII